MQTDGLQQRRSRNLALAGALVAFAVLIFAITIVRLLELR